MLKFFKSKMGYNRDIRKCQSFRMATPKNSMSKMGHNFVKKKLEDYLPYWYGFPF